MNFPIAIASYAFHGLLDEGKCDVFTYLNLLSHRYGVRYADIWTGFLPTLDPDFLRKVREEMDRRELVLANLCVDGHHLWWNTAEEREAHRKGMLETILAAKALGARTIRVDFGGTNGHTMPEEAFDYLVKTYREYCGICGDLGMRIGPENHRGWDRVPEYLEKVRDAVAHPAYGHLFHFGNFFDEPERGAGIARSYAMHTHIDAASVAVAKAEIRALAESGYQGVYSVEHHSAHLECERVEWQLATVRELIAEIKDEGLERPCAPDYISGLYSGRK